MKEGNLYAIYRIPNTHVGNVRAINEKEAICVYMKDANTFCKDRYLARRAIKGEHY